MQTEVAETIFEKVGVLSENEQKEALDFIEKLTRRRNKLRLNFF